MSKLLWRGFGLATLIASSAIAGSAQAADLPSAPPPVLQPIVPAPIVQSWTGFYFGLNAGYGRGRNSVIETGDSVSGPPSGQQAINAGAIPASLAGSPSGFLGGGQVGANWQISQFVIGFEADWQWAHINASQTVSTNVVPTFFPFTTSASQSLDSFGTARGRLGFTPIDPVLLYVTGGLAYGHAGVSATIFNPATLINPACTGFCMGASSSGTKSGWTAGGGVEWKFAPNWSAKAEYLYYDLGSISQTLTDPRFPPGPFIAQSINFKGSIARVGVNYLFNWGGPVVARY
jgi:outer membrane immunogenic protein